MTGDIATKVDAFFARYSVHHYPKGQVLILHGDIPEHVYQLLEGKVKMYDVSYRGDEVILNIFQPPAFFPMAMAINQSPSPYIYETETAATLRMAPAQETVEFIKTNSDVMFDLLSRVYRGVDGVLGRMAHLMSGSARSRLIYELLLEARRSGGTQRGPSCELHIGAKDLGARAGLTRETVSRELHKLKAAALIEVKSKNICINDVAALEAQLGPEV